MDIDRLRYFCTVAKTGSLTESATILHISQPALSKALKKLEHEIGTTLILPLGRGIMITDEGKQIANKAEYILTSLELLRPNNKVNNTTQEKIKIATFEVFSTYFMGSLLSTELEDQLFDLHELIPGEIEEAVANKIADIGITYLPIPHPELEFIEITKIKMGIFGKSSTFKSTPFDKLPFTVPIYPIRGAPTKVDGLDGWPDEKVARNIKYRVGMMESALEFCRRGKAVAYLPEFVVNLHNLQVSTDFKLQEIAPPKNLKTKKSPVYILKRKSNIENKIFRLIAKKLRALS